MCYTVSYLIKKKINLARYKGASEEELSELEQELRRQQDIEGEPHFKTTGFAHPKLPVITSEHPTKVQMIEWGLIPRWSKNMHKALESQKYTLNARCETVFDKPSFRASAKDRHCLIIVDGFFENHKHNKKAYPYYIQHKDNQPLFLAGLWEEAVIEGVAKTTCTIITCPANALMEKIHNQPAFSKEPRMPVIIPPELRNVWLRPVESPMDKQEAMELLVPYDPELMVAHPVDKRFKGHEPEAIAPTTHDLLGDIL